MASSTSLVFLVLILVALPFSTRGVDWDNIAPSLAEELCDEVECGRGKCKADGSFPIGWECECDSGWKRTPDDDDNDDLKFLPCVIPNCSLKYGGCQPAPPPVPEKEVPRNLSAFDPCYWAYCGEGKCTKNKTHTHRCECNSGYSNLLNVSAFPCYSQCTLGSDCARLGIKVADSTSSDNTNGSNQGTSFLPGKFHWMIISIMSIAFVLLK